MTRLDFYAGGKLFDSITLGNRPITVGRGRACTVRLPDSHVSRTHAVIRPCGGSSVDCEVKGWEIEDWGLNGTRVNGSPVEGIAVLLPGDRIEIEDFVIVHRLADEPTVLEDTDSEQPRRATGA